jgi:hypothetical protein
MILKLGIGSNTLVGEWYDNNYFMALLSERRKNSSEIL